mmetsp:Transcript_67469/g.152683  ORF Transcript_67469/g.152683 Transcript_67469/m.152683 type:complete len:441 (+) Transcript_67469:466-1788(+)
MQNPKRRDPKHPVGVATFWRRSKFCLAGDVHRSRSLVAILADASTAVVPNGDSDDASDGTAPTSQGASRGAVAVVNVHLEGHASKVVERLRQLESPLRELQAKHSHHGVVLVGDFNCQLDGSACTAYLTASPETVATGAKENQSQKVTAEAEALEWGLPIETPVLASVRPHNYAGFAAVPLTGCCPDDPSCPSDQDGEGVEAQRGVVQSLWSRGRKFTFCTAPGNTVDGLDQIWYTSGALQPIARRALFRSARERKALAMETGCPCRANPSDHLPVGAAFAWRQLGPQLPDLRRAAVRAVAATRHFDVLLPGLVTADADDDASVEELEARADALVAACPHLTPDQRKRFAKTLAPSPDHPSSRFEDGGFDLSAESAGGKGWPSQAEIAFLKAQQGQRKALLQEVNNEAKTSLEAAIKLRRAAGKRRKADAQRQRREKGAL